MGLEVECMRVSSRSSTNVFGKWKGDLRVVSVGVEERGVLEAESVARLGDSIESGGDKDIAGGTDALRFAANDVEGREITVSSSVLSSTTRALFSSAEGSSSFTAGWQLVINDTHARRKVSQAHASIRRRYNRPIIESERDLGESWDPEDNDEGFGVEATLAGGC